MSNTSSFVLPDLLAPGLSVVFCGTAAGPLSALRGHYYAHPQNKFWKTLYSAGFTESLLAPSDFLRLPSWGIGLTDIAKYHSGLDKQLPSISLGRTACDALKARIEACSPRYLAFTSLNAGRKVLGAATQIGEQSVRFGQTTLWVLPSPSPLAHWNWDHNVWAELGHRHRTVLKKK